MRPIALFAAGTGSLLIGSFLFLQRTRAIQRLEQSRHLAFSALSLFNSKEPEPPSKVLVEEYIKFSPKKDKIEKIDPLFLLNFIVSQPKLKKFINFSKAEANSHLLKMGDFPEKLKENKDSKEKPTVNDLIALFETGQADSSKAVQRLRRFCEGCGVAFNLVRDFLESHCDYLLFMDIFMLIELEISKKNHVGVLRETARDGEMEAPKRAKEMVRALKKMPNDFRRSVALNSFLFKNRFSIFQEFIDGFKEEILKELKLPKPIDIVDGSLIVNKGKEGVPMIDKGGIDVLAAIIEELDLLFMKREKKVLSEKEISAKLAKAAKEAKEPKTNQVKTKET